MKQSQIINYYLDLVEQAEALGLKIEPLYESFRILEGTNCICVADDLNVVAGFLSATEHYTNKTQIAP